MKYPDLNREKSSKMKKKEKMFDNFEFPLKK